MNVFDNPFYTLGVSTRSKKADILSAAEDLELLHDDSAARDRANSIINPVTRLEAEISWFPGADPAAVQAFLEEIKKGGAPEFAAAESFLQESKLACARVTVLAALLCCHTAATAPVCVRYLREMADCYENIDLESLLSSINTDRRAAGIAVVEDTDRVKAAVGSYAEYLASVGKLALDRLPTDDLMAAVTELVEVTTKKGKDIAPSLIYKLVDIYEIETQAFFYTATPALEQLIATVKERADKKEPVQTISLLVDKLLQMTRQWDAVAQPIQMAMESKGLEHEASLDLASELRNLSVDLCNDHGYVELAQRIIAAISHIFAELFTAAAAFQKDMEVLRSFAPSDSQAEATEASTPDYTATLEPAAKKQIQMTQDYIRAGSETVYLKNIGHLAWGRIRRQEDTLYIIRVKTYSGEFHEFSLGNRPDIFSELTKRLWELVGVRLGLELIQALQAGKEKSFGQVLVRDDGLVFQNQATKGSGKGLYAWHELKLLSGQDGFSLTSVRQPSVRVYLDFLIVQDALLLETLLSMVFKQGLHRISDVLL